MGEFRKKPVVIAAVKFDGVEVVEDVPTPMFDGSFAPKEEWLRAALAMHEARIVAVYIEGENVQIHTLEGDMTAMPGDWIICGVKGELYSCKLQYGAR